MLMDVFDLIDNNLERFIGECGDYLGLKVDGIGIVRAVLQVFVDVPYYGFIDMIGLLMCNIFKLIIKIFEKEAQCIFLVFHGLYGGTEGVFKGQ